MLADEDPAEPFDLADIYRRLALQGMLAGYEVKQRFYEIGSHRGLAETVSYFEGRGEG